MTTHAMANSVPFYKFILSFIVLLVSPFYAIVVYRGPY